MSYPGGFSRPVVCHDLIAVGRDVEVGAVAGGVDDHHGVFVFRTYSSNIPVPVAAAVALENANTSVFVESGVVHRHTVVGEEYRFLAFVVNADFRDTGLREISPGHNFAVS